MDAQPEWLALLTDALPAHLVAAALPAPLGVHVQKADDDPQRGVWEVSVFYGKTEIVGGAKDGRRTDTPFWLDLRGLTDVFDRVENFYWQAAPLGDGDDLGPHVAIEGEFQGHPVRVRILAAAPASFPPARVADTLDGTFVDLW